MAKIFYKSLILLTKVRLICIVVNVNLHDKSLFVQLPGGKSDKSKKGEEHGNHQ